MSMVVIGGSQGARILSDVVPAAVALLPEALRGQPARRPSGPRSRMPTRAAQAYDAAGIRAEIAPFFADIPRRLSEAQLVISRSGASSVADISVIGRPSILIPYAAATGDHQTANARGLVDAGAAILIPEKLLDAGRRSRATSPRSWKTPRRPRPWRAMRWARANPMRQPALSRLSKIWQETTGMRPHERRHQTAAGTGPHPFRRHRRHRHVGHRRGADEPGLPGAGVGCQSLEDHRPAGGSGRRLLRGPAGREYRRGGGGGDFLRHQEGQPRTGRGARCASCPWCAGPRCWPN